MLSLLRVYKSIVIPTKFPGYATVTKDHRSSEAERNEIISGITDRWNRLGLPRLGHKDTSWIPRRSYYFTPGILTGRL